MWADWCKLNALYLSDSPESDDFIEIKMHDLRRFAAVFMQAGMNQMMGKKGGESDGEADSGSIDFCRTVVG